MSNRCVVVARQPAGVPTPEDFRIEEVGPPEGDGPLCETLYISVDPYLRGRLSGRHLTGAIEPGQPMNSELVVRLPDGSLARGFGPWQEQVRIANPSPIKPEIEPASLALGVLGMPGLTAYAGISRILKPQTGETLLVSAAGGPVGATVGQLAKRAGARTVGIAGSDEKCRWLTESAGFDAAINYKSQPLAEALDATCSEGIDLYFDNVGGSVLKTAMERLRIGARVALCGLMEQYNTDTPPPGPNPALIIKARAHVQGLVVYDHEDLRAEMEHTLSPLFGSGAFAYREHRAQGIEQAPVAFCTLMRGENFGKTIVVL